MSAATLTADAVPAPSVSPPAADEAAMVAAVRRWERPLLAFAARIVRDPEQARDIVQDTFSRLAQAGGPAAFAANGPGAWLFTVCRRRALDWCRRAGRVSAVDVDDPVLADAPGPDAPPDEVLARKEDGAQLGRLVARLPARQQELIQLRFQQDLSYREMADVTGRTVTNVGFLLHTALRRLRDWSAELPRP